MNIIDCQTKVGETLYGLCSVLNSNSEFIKSKVQLTVLLSIDLKKKKKKTVYIFSSLK